LDLQGEHGRNGEPGLTFDVLVVIVVEFPERDDLARKGRLRLVVPEDAQLELPADNAFLDEDGRIVAERDGEGCREPGAFRDLGDPDA
jgi:hypothetical protein